MSVVDLICSREIEEALHFTTNHGCLGTLYGKRLLSRAQLYDDEMVRYLFSPNAELRKDLDYLDHISLSIDRINYKFFNICANKWHREEPIFWCVLSFDAVVLAHDGVEFATTNNMYTGVNRAKGPAGFDAMFSDRITQWIGSVVTRTRSHQRNHTTCAQAEALYPSSLSTQYLRKIYVRTVQDQSEVLGFLKASFHSDVDVLVSPEKFGAC